MGRDRKGLLFQLLQVGLCFFLCYFRRFTKDQVIDTVSLFFSFFFLELATFRCFPPLDPKFLEQLETRTSITIPTRTKFQDTTFKTTLIARTFSPLHPLKKPKRKNSDTCPIVAKPTQKHETLRLLPGPLVQSGCRLDKKPRFKFFCSVVQECQKMVL